MTRCAESPCSRLARSKCEWPLIGRKAGQTCSRALCVDHAQRDRTEEQTLCPAHMRQREKDDAIFVAEVRKLQREVWRFIADEKNAPPEMWPRWLYEERRQSA